MSKWNPEALRMVIPEGAAVGAARYHGRRSIPKAAGPDDPIGRVMADQAAVDLPGNVTLIAESKA